MPSRLNSALRPSCAACCTGPLYPWRILIEKSIQMRHQQTYHWHVASVVVNKPKLRVQLRLVLWGLEGHDCRHRPIVRTDTEDAQIVAQLFIGPTSAPKIDLSVCALSSHTCSISSTATTSSCCWGESDQMNSSSMNAIAQ